MKRRTLLGGQRYVLPADLVEGFIHGYSYARKLRKDYGGNIMLVSRTATGGDIAIGFNGNLVSESDLLAAYPGNNIVGRWLYDQIGSREIRQNTNLSNAPIIRTAAGDIVKVSDRVYAQFDGTDDYLNTSSSATPITDKDCTVFVVFESQSGLSLGGVFEEVNTATPNQRNVIYSDTRNTLFRHSNYAPDGTGRLIDFPSQQPQSTKRCLILQRSGNDVTAFDETGLQIGSTVTSSVTFSVDTVLELGRQLAAGYFSGKIAELLINNTALSTTDINIVLDNIKEFYSIT